MSEDLNRPELPEYACIKRIRAGKIVRIDHPAIEGSRLYHLYLEVRPGSFIQQPVPVDFIKRYKPEVGGYFVRGEDGTAVYLPQALFDATYSRAPNLKPITLPELEGLASMRPQVDLFRRDIPISTTQASETPHEIASRHALGGCK